MRVITQQFKKMKDKSCDLSFTHKEKLDIHSSILHEETMPFQCKNCNVSFISKICLNEHVSIVHKVEKPFKCKICSSSYVEIQSLKRHHENVHTEQVLTLGIGGIVTMKNQRVAQTILVTPTAVKQKPISPEKENPKILTSESEIEEKLKKILKPKRKAKFNCALCNMGFTRKNSLEQHKTSVHDRIKPFECENENCDSTFARKFELQRHVSTVHDKIIPIKRFKCTVHPCISAFSHKGHWSEHLKKSHGEKNPYKCEICIDVEFATKNELNHHNNKVHKVKMKAKKSMMIQNTS